MFGWLAKRTESYKRLQESYNEKTNEILEQSTRIDTLEENLQEIVEKVKKGGMFIEEGNSSVTLEINNELNVTVSSRINKDIVETLIDNNYITSVQSEDEQSVNFAFILIANEATEQIIENVNNLDLG